MSAGRAADAIRLDREFVSSNPHDSAVRAASQLHSLISERLVLAAAKTIDGFPVQQPRLPRIVEHISGNGTRLANMNILKPSLEDVFIHLTGKALRD